ncbi:MAG: ornithine carbamoyltransferase [Sumerlaeia bacterium]
MPDLISIADLTRSDAEDLLKLAAKLKAEWHASLSANKAQKPHLAGKTLAMIFEKPSLRTRCSFEAGMFQLGGTAINLNASEVGRLGERESISDTARNLSRWVQIIQARVFAHKSVEELAEWSDAPVINGLSDFEHPTQIMADYLTIREHRANFTDGLRLAWVGDGNNVAHSLMMMACIFGHEMHLAVPAGYDPADRAWSLCEKLNPKARDLIRVFRDPKEAVKGAHVLYTDVWASMGQEAEKEKRAKAFEGFQINDALLDLAEPGAFAMHDLPAKRGLEITDEVIDGDRNAIFDQAENRMHTIKAALCWCLGLGG